MFSASQKAIFLVITIAVALFAASPAIQHYLVYPQETPFTEFWLLDLTHAAENYPYNITSGSNSLVYFGIANHLSHYGYYVIEVKLRNYSEPGPDSLVGTPSNLPSLYNITMFVPNQEWREVPLSFSLNFTLDEPTTVNNVVLNDVNINIGPWLLYHNDTVGEYACNLFFELWIYNSNINDFQYHQRSLGLHLSLTDPNKGV